MKMIFLQWNWSSPNRANQGLLVTLDCFTLRCVEISWGWVDLAEKTRRKFFAPFWWAQSFTETAQPSFFSTHFKLPHCNWAVHTCFRWFCDDIFRWKLAISICFESLKNTELDDHVYHIERYRLGLNRFEQNNSNFDLLMQLCWPNSCPMINHQF